jgi:Fe-S-cluster containining protein
MSNIESPSMGKREEIVYANRPITCREYKLMLNTDELKKEMKA